MATIPIFLHWGHAMRVQETVAILTCALVVAANATACCKSAAADELDRYTVKELIGQLANKNKPPAQQGAKAHPIWTKDYDWTEQTRIRNVWKELHRRAEEDLSEIVAHVDDTRYSLTMAVSSGAYYNADIGFICYHILRVNIEPYQRPGDKRFEAFMPYSGNREDVAKWWTPRRGTRLKDLQLQSIEHAQKTTVDRLDTANDENEKERFRSLLSKLDELTDEIRQTNKPVAVPAIAPEEYRFASPKK